jgi:hypothetical protein
LLLSEVWRKRQTVLAVIQPTAAKILETNRPVETSHAWRVFYFRRMQSFHDLAGHTWRILLLSRGEAGRGDRVCTANEARLRGTRRGRADGRAAETDPYGRRGSHGPNHSPRRLAQTGPYGRQKTAGSETSRARPGPTAPAQGPAAPAGRFVSRVGD